MSQACCRRAVHDGQPPRPLSCWGSTACLTACLVQKTSQRAQLKCLWEQCPGCSCYHIIFSLPGSAYQKPFLAKQALQTEIRPISIEADLNGINLVVYDTSTPSSARCFKPKTCLGLSRMRRNYFDTCFETCRRSYTQTMLLLYVLRATGRERAQITTSQVENA